jgi:hypothetical protein
MEQQDQEDSELETQDKRTEGSLSKRLGFSQGKNMDTKKEHWYKIFYHVIKQMRLWVPSFGAFCWLWSLFNGLALVAIFIFWWQSNEEPDSPSTTENFSMGYDLVLLLAIITRFLISSWSMMFWGSVGNIWWLRIAFLEILAALAVSITALVYMYSINTLAFGFYLAYTVWELIILYYTGVFLRVCYDLRLKNNETHKSHNNKFGHTY